MTGKAVYVDDIPEPPNLVHVACGLSTIPSGVIKSIDLDQVWSSEGVVDVITWEDVPGSNDVSPVYDGDKLLAEGRVEFVGQPVFAVAANSFALARTIEYFRIPRNVLTICLGKSTYARCGIIVNVTPLEPEWEGHVTLEFSNTTPLPAKIYANEGVAQMIFLESDEDCDESYRDRKGKYQGQTGVTLPKT